MSRSNVPVYIQGDNVTVNATFTKADGTTASVPEIVRFIFVRFYEPGWTGTFRRVYEWDTAAEPGDSHITKTDGSNYTFSATTDEIGTGAWTTHIEGEHSSSADDNHRHVIEGPIIPAEQPNTTGTLP
jgi:hypothetical protein